MPLYALVEAELESQHISFKIDLDNLAKILGKNPKSEAKGGDFDFSLEFAYDENEDGGFEITIEIGGERGIGGGGENEEDEGGGEGGEGEEEDEKVSASIGGTIQLKLFFDNKGELVGYSVSGSVELSVEVEIFEYKYFVTFTIGPVPVWIEIDLSGKLGFKVRAGGTIFGTPTERTNITVKLYLGVELEALLYSTAGGSGEIKPFIQAKYFVDERLWLVFGGAALSLDAKFKIRPWITYTLWSAEWEFSTPIFAFQRDGGKGGDAGDYLANAREIDSKGTYVGYLGRDSLWRVDEKDFYKVRLKSGDIVRLNLSRGSEHSDDANFDLYLYDNAGNLLGSSSSDAGEEDRIESMVPATGDYYIEVSKASGMWSWGTYTLRTDKESQNDMRSGGDAGNKIEEALNLTTSLLPYLLQGENGYYTVEFVSSENCYVGGSDQYDFYKVNVMAAGHMLKARLDPPDGANFDLYVYGPDQTVLASSKNPDDSPDSVNLRVTSSGWYYIEVRRVSGAGRYSLEVTREQWDIKEGDACSSRSQSRPISQGRYRNCYLDELDTTDVYSFPVTQDKLIDVVLTQPQDVEYWVYLLDPYGGLVASSRERILTCATYSGTYYLQMWRKSGRGLYDFELWLRDQEDGGTYTDAGDSESSALALPYETRTHEAGITFIRMNAAGWVGGGDPEDFYKIPVEAGKTLFVKLEGADDETEMYLPNFTGTIFSYDKVGRNWFFCGKAEGYTGSREVYIRTTNGGRGCFYSLSFSVAPENDGGSGGDAGWVQGQEVTLKAGENYWGYLDACDTEDLYKVWLGMDDQLTLRMSGHDSNFDLYFYDSTAVYRGENTVPSVSSTNPDSSESITYLAHHAGWYYFRVKRESGLGAYKLELSVLSVPWPKEMHDVKNTGRGAYPGPEENTMSWRYKVNEPSTFSSCPDPSPVVSSDDTVYAAAGGFLHAFDRYGNLKWKVPVENIFWRSSPLIGSDGTIYLAHDSRLSAFNPKDGSLKWSCNLGDIVLGAPTIGPDGTIFVPCSHLHAVNPNGTIKWSWEGWTTTTPAIGSDGTVYFVAFIIRGKDIQYSLYALYPENGGEKWKYGTAGVAVPPVMGPDDTVYLGHENALVAINPNGTLKWSRTFENLFLGIPAIDNDGTIYLPGVSFRISGGYVFENAVLMALNPSNGSTRWVFSIRSPYYPMPAGVSSPAIGSGDTVYFGLNRIIFAVNKNGGLKWTFDAGGLVNSPAIGRNRAIYFISSDGYLYAIEDDTTPPFSSVAHPADGAVLNGINEIIVQASDYFSGVQSVEVVIKRERDGAFLLPGGWENVGEEDAWRMAQFSDSDNCWRLSVPSEAFSSGWYVVNTRATDAAGNRERPSSVATYYNRGGVSFFVDSIPPAGYIRINNGEGSTRCTDVVLYLWYSDYANCTEESGYCSSGVVSARYSNDGVSWTEWEPVSTSRSWTLDPKTCTVYYQVIDLAGNVSEVASDTITLENEVPPPEPESPSSEGEVFDWIPEFKWSSRDLLPGEAYLLEIEREDGSSRVTLITRSRTVCYTLPGISARIVSGLQKGESLGYRWRVSILAPFVDAQKSSKWRYFRLSRDNRENSTMELFAGALENKLRLGTVLKNKRDLLTGGLGGVVSLPMKLQIKAGETGEIRTISKMMVKTGMVVPGETVSTFTDLSPPQSGDYQISCELGGGSISKAPQRVENKQVKTQPDLIASASDTAYDEKLALITTRVYNRGTAAAGSFSVAFYLEEEGPTTVLLEGLAAGDAATVSMSAKLPRGTVSVRIVVDPEGKVEESDEGNNEATALVTSLRGAPPVANFTYSPSSPSVNASVNFTDTSADNDGKIVAWSWDFGDKTTSTLQNPTHTYSSTGTYTVTLTVTDDAGNTASCSKQVVVTQPNKPPTASFSYEEIDYLTVRFTDQSSDPDGSIVAWSWSFGDGATSSERNPTHVYPEGHKSYTVRLTVTDDRGATASYETSVYLMG
ncbi:MAG: PKD domain-containing protein [Candidatus Hadarchaeales archaeon]